MVKIVVIGSFNMDLITYVKRIPVIGETVTDGELITMPGGKGSNQAVGVARLGADVTFIACVGNDQFADTAFDIWQAEHIDTDYITRIDDIATGTASILVDSQGENIIAVAPGANRHLTRQNIDDAESVIATADIVMVQLEISLDVVEYALQTAKKYQVRTLLNPAPIRNNIDNIIALADIITPNEGEAKKLRGITTEKLFVTTLGSKGASWKQDEEEGTVSAFEVEAIDTVGGGDAFNAGLAIALAEKQAIAEAIDFANAVAAIAVTRKGAANSMPTRDEVHSLMNEKK